jgi:hypothetical protein
MAEKPKPTMLNKNDPDSVYNWIVYKLSLPEFSDPIKIYINDNCSTFVNIVGENSHEQGNIFNTFNVILESLLNNILDEGHITQEDFLKAADRGLNDPKYRKYFNQILSLGNYGYFKVIMTKRNYQKIRQAEGKMNNEKEKQIFDNMINEITPELIKLILETDEFAQYQSDENMKNSLEDEIKRRLSIIEEEERRRALKQKQVPKKEGENKQKKDDKKYINQNPEEKVDSVKNSDKQNNLLLPLLKKDYIPNPYKRDKGNEVELKKDIIQNSVKQSIIKYEDMLELINDDDDYDY